MNPAERPAVLVVDDEAPVRRMLVRALARRGFEVLEADTGQIALEVIAASDVDVVLLDGVLPDMPGHVVLEKLRSSAETATLPVLLVTGQDDIDHRVSGLEAGADDFIAKPVDLDELVARVQSRLRGRDAWRSHVESTLHERARLAGAIAGIQPDRSPSDIAGEVADVLVRLPGVIAASLVSLSADGCARHLAGVDLEGTTLAGPGDPVDPPTVAELHQVLRSGLGTMPGEAGRRLMPCGPGAVVVAALTGESGPVAAMALGTDAESVRAADSRRALGAALDLAPVVERVLVPALELAEGHSVVDELRSVIDETAYHPVYQPIVGLADGTVEGYEALTRFADGARPDLRFAEASRVGMGAELEMVTMDAAVRGAVELPERAFLSLNVSAAVLTGHDLRPLVDLAGGRPLVFELTEHERVDDYELVRRAIEELGPDVRLSVDDAGSGWASLRHVLALRPHFVKLDRGWISAIETDPARQALLLGIAGFAASFGGAVVAEGIETAEELAGLAHLGISLGQGYHLGRPAPIGQARGG